MIFKKATYMATYLFLPTGLFVPEHRLHLPVPFLLSVIE
jgi:hypothetical protein